jgi:predicted kinase
MVQMHIYRGLQGSGKSTLAFEKAAVDGGRVVGRDHIRRLMGVNGLGTKKQENEVTILQGRLIVEGLRAGQNIHVDDMNLKATYVRRLMSLAEKFQADVIIEDLTHVPVEVCIARDAARGSSKIGEKLIRNNYDRFVQGRNGQPLEVPSSGLYDARLLPGELYVPNTTKPKAMLVDLDGTTALKSPTRGIHDYDHRVFDDLPNAPVVRAVQAMIQAGIVPIYLSGRKDYPACREATQRWIQKHIVYYSHPVLYLRQAHDNRPDWIVKREIFDNKIRNNWNVVFAWDDRDQVVEMYREMNLTVFQVAPGGF